MNSNLYEKTTNGNVLYIRHGQTKYNQACLTTSKELLRSLPEYLDCPLSDQGIKQSTELSECLNTFNVKYVFCSPLLRCLQTCLYSLEEHPKKESLSVIVHPFITETVGGMHDYSLKIIEKQENFSETSKIKFDWSVFNSMFETQTQRELYYLTFTDSLDEGDSKAKSIFKNLFEWNGKTNYESIRDLLSELAEHYVSLKQKPESLKGMFNRNLKFKQFLKENYIPLLKEDEKILVFTHSAFTRLSTSKLAYEMEVISDYPEDCLRLNNCEVLSMNI